VKVTDATMIRYHLEKAVYLAKEGRRGPVWIDLPIDIQGMSIDEAELKGFDPSECKPLRRLSDGGRPGQAARVIELLKQSSRPVILAGSGIRDAGAEQELLKLVDRLMVPVLTSRRGADLVPDSHPYFFGRPGAYGQRSANFIIQNSDLLISLGSRLSIPLIGRNTRAFARGARKVIVDIDPAELEKPTINPDLAIAADAGEFIRELLDSLPLRLPDYSDWIERCREWRRAFPPDSYSGPSLPFKDPEPNGPIYPLPLLRALSDELDEGDVLVADGGPPLIYTLLAFRFKAGQRLISSPGLELSGFGLSGAIGASVGRERKPVICLCEDRGFQISLQEIQTLLDYRLPVKVIVLKSKGHSIIRNIQNDYFGGRFVGTDNEIRLGTAPLIQIAKTYGLPTCEVLRMDQFSPSFRETRAIAGPAVCEIHLENDQAMIPRPDFIIRADQKWVAKPLEDMYPLLDREVLKQHMLIDLFQED
jgi:acetolactate synthase-1/2/3 large subunit